MATNLGNPAPMGLLAFGMTTMMLMYVETGWAESDFEVIVSGYAVFFGGIGQMLVAIFELCKGSSFSFAVFFSYGAFWLGWAIVYIESAKDYSNYREAAYPTGMTLFFIQWGSLSMCFWIITLRKNVCLAVVFFLLFTCFFLLSAATATNSLALKRTAGYVGFLTALGALYTGVAELINEEWGHHVLPGLHPIHAPERLAITKESIEKLCIYDNNSKTLFLQFAGLQIYRIVDIDSIREGVSAAILTATEGAKEHKVHVIANYKDVSIAKELEEAYWSMTRSMERNYYLSVRRFAVSSFGTRSGEVNPQRGAALSNQLAEQSELYYGSSKEENNNFEAIDSTFKAEEGSS